MAKRPEGIPSDDVFRYETVEIDRPKQDEIQIESCYISVDPYMRGRMDDSESYSPIRVRQTNEWSCSGESCQIKYRWIVKDDIVTGTFPWQKIVNIKAKHAIKVSQTDIPLYLYLSVLGMTGQTAYHGLLKSDNHKKVRLFVVSSCFWCGWLSCRSDSKLKVHM